MRLALLAAVAFTIPAFAQDKDTQTPQPPDPSFGTTVVIPGGLQGIVYLIPKDSTVLPDFKSDTVERVGEIWTDALDVSPRHWRSGFPGLTGRFEWFAIDYSGRFWIDQPGRYTFALLSDDGSRLFLDDTPIIDNDCLHSPDLRIAAVELAGGVHSVRVSYFQGPRDCLALMLAIAGSDHHWRIFSTKEFKPPPNPDDWKFPGSNSVSMVPVTPEEASLSIKHLFDQVKEAQPEEDNGKKWKATRGCAAWAAVRTCSN